MIMLNTRGITCDTPPDDHQIRSQRAALTESPEWNRETETFQRSRSRGHVSLAIRGLQHDQYGGWAYFQVAPIEVISLEPPGTVK